MHKRFLIKPPSRRAINRFATGDYIPYMSCDGGSTFHEQVGSPNPDNHDVFGPSIYLVLRLTGDQGETEPVACCTSMAVARALMKSENFTATHIARDEQLPQAERPFSRRDYFMQNPGVQIMMANRRAAVKKLHAREARNKARREARKAAQQAAHSA